MNQSSHKLREQHWMSIIQQCNRESLKEGITKKEWLERKNINYHSFYRLQRQLRNDFACDLLVTQAQAPVPVAVESSTPQFVEVVPPSPCPMNDIPSKAVLR